MMRTIVLILRTERNPAIRSMRCQKAILKSRELLLGQAPTTRQMGRVILAHEGTLERFAGDGMMVFFNDPVEVDDPAERAVRMTAEMRERLSELTIGAVGFEGRWDYGAIGTVTNLAARLCGEAAPGQILIARRVLGSVEALVDVEPVGELALKGLLRPVSAFNLIRLR
jgi:class 3 adenylate cyclase